MSKVVVVGGGITGLVAAHLARRVRPESEVVLIEADQQFGGLLSCFDYGEEIGKFDIGAHNFTSTGIDAVDELVLGALPDDGWNQLVDDKRDLAGSYYAGRLQLNTPFVDLRGDERLGFFIEDLKRHFGRSPERPATTLGEVSLEQFGPLITDQVMRPIVEKIYGKPPRLLEPVAGRIVPLQRVCLYDRETMEALAGEPINAVLAVPEQRGYAGNKNHPTRGFYPKKFGMYRVIEGLVRSAEELGIRVLASTRVTGARVANKRITSLAIRSGPDGSATIDDVEALVWTVGVPQILNLLDVEVDLSGYDRPPKTVVCSMVLDRPPATGDLYYFYCFDEGFSTLRVTNFSSYCPEAAADGQYRVSVEMLVDHVPEQGLESLAERAIDECLRMGVIGDRDTVKFARAEVLRSGFPMPSVANNRLIEGGWNAVDRLEIENLVRVGILAKRGLFFQTEVLADVFRELERHFD